MALLAAEEWIKKNESCDIHTYTKEPLHLNNLLEYEDKLKLIDLYETGVTRLCSFECNLYKNISQSYFINILGF